MNRTFFAAFTLAALGFNACTVDGTDSGSNDATEIDANAKNGGEVEVYRSVSSDKYDFRLEAKNGEILVQSGQRYDALDGAMNGALSLKENGVSSEAYELVPSSSNVEGRYDGDWFFRVKAQNGRTLAFSEIYSSKGAAKKGAQATMAYLKGKTKVDMWSDQCGFEMFTGRDGKEWFRLRADNGAKILRSQGYSSEAAAKDGIDTVVTTAIVARDRVVDRTAGESMGNTQRFEIYESDAGGFGWRLVAANNQTVATGGELFETKEAALDSLQLVRDHAFDEAACWTARSDSQLPLLAPEDLGADEEVAASLPTVDPTFTPTDLDAEATAGGEVEIYRSSRSGKYDFRLEAKNGLIVLQSGQRYERAGAALDGALSLKENGQLSERYELSPSTDNPEGRADMGWFFRVKASNGAVLAFSEVYGTKSDAKVAANTAMGYLRGETKADLWTDQCGFELYTGEDDGYWFRLQADNGERLLRSQSYGDESAAKTGIDTVVTTAIIARDEVVDLSAGESAGNAARFEIYEADVASGVSERWGWRLKAANNEIVASGGELFSSKDAALDSLDLVREHAFDEIACWTARNDEALPALDAEALGEELATLD
ncbi:MAG: DUF1508 domain-containing protein [Myxococcales bacterium]|nr:DUF1508 domain-containing protein [Myxococcales bacterium]